MSQNGEGQGKEEKMLQKERSQCETEERKERQQDKPNLVKIDLFFNNFGTLTNKSVFRTTNIHEPVYTIHNSVKKRK
jgi:uridine kinase